MARNRQFLIPNSIGRPINEAVCEVAREFCRSSAFRLEEADEAEAKGTGDCRLECSVDRRHRAGRIHLLAGPNG